MEDAACSNQDLDMNSVGTQEPGQGHHNRVDVGRGRASEVEKAPIRESRRLSNSMLKMTLRFFALI